MPRIAVPALAAIFLVVQICCAPPLRAAASEAAEPMHCPMQKQQECDTAETQECSGGPQLVSEAPVKKFLSPVPLQTIAVVAREPVAHAKPGIIAGWWSTPTRTTQLRI